MFCGKCGKEISDNSTFCPYCGEPLNGGAHHAGGTVQSPYAAPDSKDHTSEFDAKDISDNKVIAMLPYLMGVVGVLIAIIAAKESPYVSFHVREALKFTVCEILLTLIGVILCFTIVIPIIAAIMGIILFVCRIISFVRICKGKAVTAPIAGDIGFLK